MLSDDHGVVTDGRIVSISAMSGPARVHLPIVFQFLLNFLTNVNLMQVLLLLLIGTVKST